MERTLVYAINRRENACANPDTEENVATNAYRVITGIRIVNRAIAAMWEQRRAFAMRRGSVRVFRTLRDVRATSVVPDIISTRNVCRVIAIRMEPLVSLAIMKESVSAIIISII